MWTFHKIHRSWIGVTYSTLFHIPTSNLLIWGTQCFLFWRILQTFENVKTDGVESAKMLNTFSQNSFFREIELLSVWDGLFWCNGKCAIKEYGSKVVWRRGYPWTGGEKSFDGDVETREPKIGPHKSIQILQHPFSWSLTTLLIEDHVQIKHTQWVKCINRSLSATDKNRISVRHFLCTFLFILHRQGKNATWLCERSRLFTQLVSEVTECPSRTFLASHTSPN